MELNEFIDEAKRWEPPKPSDIKYSKISEKRREYLERKKRGGGNGKKTESRTENEAGRKGKKEHDGRQNLGGETSRRNRTRRRAGRRSAERKTEG